MPNSPLSWEIESRKYGWNSPKSLQLSIFPIFNVYLNWSCMTSWVTKIDTLTWNPWEIRGFSVFIPCFFKACFIDTQGHFRALGRTWTKFSADLACLMAGSTLSDTFYCSSFLNNLKLFIEEVGSYLIPTSFQFIKSLGRRWASNEHRSCNLSPLRRNQQRPLRPDAYR